MYAVSNLRRRETTALEVHLQQALKPSLVSRFTKWAEGQESARFIWLGLTLLSHASLLTPFTVMAVVLTGNSFPLIMAALAAMALALVTHLAALPTRITVPAFFLSIVIDIVIVAIALLG